MKKKQAKCHEKHKEERRAFIRQVILIVVSEIFGIAGSVAVVLLIGAT